MNKSRLLILFVVLILTMSLVGSAVGADQAQKANPPDNGSRGGTTDTTPPVVYISPAAFNEGFEDILNLPDWYMQNNSSPLGIIGWFQGNDAVFPAQAGSTTSYIGANFNSTGSIGTISNWLLTPVQPIGDGAVLSFYTRTATGSAWPDRLQVRLSTEGDSTDVGTGPEDVGDFTNLLLDINPDLAVGGYPDVWTQYNITLSGVAAGSGRLAFRYYVTGGGSSGDNSNYIGIDTVEYVDPILEGPSFGGSSKEAPEVVEIGEVISYTIEIINSGVDPALDASMTDPIPVGTNYNDDVACTSGDCSYDAEAGTVMWAGEVEAGDDVDVTFSVTPNTGLCGVTIENEATITDPEAPGPVTVSASTFVSGPQVLFEDFEEDDGGYTVSGNPWTWGPPPTGLAPAHSGVNVWATESPYVNSGDYQLISSAIDLTVADPDRPLSLSWWQKLDVEVGFDFADVYVSTDGGTNWDFLWEGNYHGSWEQITVDISAYNGETIMLLFELTTDSSVIYNGWAIDDVSIFSGCLPPDIAVEPLSLSEELLTDSTATQDLQVCNQGESTLHWALAEVPEIGSLAAPSATFVPSVPSAPRQVELTLGNLTASGNKTNVPIIPEDAVPLVLDDGSAENNIGVNDGLTEIQFIWLNRFTPDSDLIPFNLNQIQVFFDAGTNVAVGNAIDLVVYHDSDGDPTNGATWLATYNVTVQYVDGSTWSVYDLAEPLLIDTPGDVLIAAINRYTVSGVSTPTFPAAVDQGLSQLRSWAGWWLADPPDPAVLPPDDVFDLIDNFGFAGNWMIRGYGETGPAPDILWLSETPLSGEVVAGECEVVEVTFDSTGLAAGTYTGALKITSDDPDESPLTIPVELKVGEPDIVVGTSLEMTLDLNSTGTITFTIGNVGDIDLDWTSLVTGTWMTIDPAAGTVNEGEEGEVEVNFNSTGLAPGEYTGFITIFSNDLDESPAVINVLLTVNPYKFSIPLVYKLY